MSLLGIDVGTSGCKATILNDEGVVLGSSYKEYSTVSLRTGWQELDPRRVWDSVKEVVSRALSQNSGDPIAAISVSSFGEAAVPINHKGEPLHNSILYIDTRGKDEAEYLNERLGKDKVLSIAGAPIHPMYTICKIMWLKKHKPELYESTWKFLLFADFILFMLGAKPHTDYSLAARTMAFDVAKKEWSREILDCAGVSVDKFGEAVQSGTVVGRISAAAADEIGLPKQVLLVSGGHDQPCAALGAGVIKSGMAVDGLGTTECITPAFDRPVISEIMADAGFACVPHVVKELYVTYAFTFTSGSLLKWYKDFFGAGLIAEATQKGVNVYDLMIEEGLKGSGEIFVLPHFAGAATPYMDVSAKGAIVGMNITTGPKDILRGILEGITYEIMVNVERLDTAGVFIDDIRVVGGLSKSESYLQMKADVMGKKISTLNVSEAGTLGAAIIAGAACGIYKNIPEAVDILVRKNREFIPDMKQHKYYRERFDTYKKIYPAVKSIF